MDKQTINAALSTYSQPQLAAMAGAAKRRWLGTDADSRHYMDRLERMHELQRLAAYAQSPLWVRVARLGV